MGKVVDIREAKATGCTAYQIKESPELNPREYPEAFQSYSKGVKGTLSDAQEKMFCEESESLIVPKSLTEDMSMGQHQEKFEVMGQIMDRCLSKDFDDVDDFAGCVAEEAERYSEQH